MLHVAIDNNSDTINKPLGHSGSYMTDVQKIFIHVNIHVYTNNTWYMSNGMMSGNSSSSLWTGTYKMWQMQS